jgi:hypothetical protein
MTLKTPKAPKALSKPKQVAAPRAPAPRISAPAPALSEATVLQLDAVTRLTLCRYEAEVRAARHQMVAEQAQLAQYLAKIDKEGYVAQKQATISTLIQQISAMQARYDQTAQQVEHDLHISLKNYSFDDESGILHEVVSSAAVT